MAGNLWDCLSFLYYSNDEKYILRNIYIVKCCHLMRRDEKNKNRMYVRVCIEETK